MPQCMLVIESMIDDVALKLGRPSEEVGVMQSQKDVLLLVCLFHYTSKLLLIELMNCWYLREYTFFFFFFLIFICMFSFY